MSDDSSEPLLSNEETDALLDAMKKPQEAGNEVTGLDLGSPEARLRGIFPLADRAAHQISFDTRKVILRTAGCGAEVEEYPAETLPFGVFSSTVVAGSAVAVLRVGGGKGFLYLSPSIVSFILDRRLGAPVRNEEVTGEGEPDRNELSDVDWRLILPFLNELINVFGVRWEVESSSLQLINLVSKHNELPEMGQFEPLLRMAIRVAPVGSESGEIIFLIDAPAIASTGPKDPDQISTPDPSEKDVARMKSCITATDVEVVAVLGEAAVDVGKILSLKEGDIVRLDSIPNMPNEIRVEGKPLLYGTPLVHHGNLAVKVTYADQQR